MSPPARGEMPQPSADGLTSVNKENVLLKGPYYPLPQSPRVMAQAGRAVVAAETVVVKVAAEAAALIFIFLPVSDTVCPVRCGRAGAPVVRHRKEEL